MAAKSASLVEVGADVTGSLAKYNVDCTASKKGIQRFQVTSTTNNGGVLTGITSECDARYTLSGSSTSKSTVSNDYGNGDTRFLDRHFVDCGTKALMQWKLIMDGTTKFRMDYKCSTEDMNSIFSLTTQLDEDGAGNAIYLDRHNVACPSNTVMTSWRYVRNAAGDKFRIVFNCGYVPPALRNEAFSSEMLVSFPVSCASDTAVSALTGFRVTTSSSIVNGVAKTCSTGTAVTGPIVTKSTNLDDSGYGNTVYFDRHSMDCGANALLGFRLRYITLDKMKFDYQCSTSTVINIVEKTTAFDLDGTGQVQFLDRHDVKCDTNQVITRVRLVRSTDLTKYQFVFGCGTPTTATATSAASTSTTSTSSGTTATSTIATGVLCPQSKKTVTTDTLPDGTVRTTNTLTSTYVPCSSA